MSFVDASELSRLTADLTRAAVLAPLAVRPMVQKAALNIKNEWRENWSGIAHAPALPYAVGYDTIERPWGAEAEIGPDKDKRQGALGNIIEYGTSKNPPIPGGAPALANEAPRLEIAIAGLVDGLL